MREVLKQWENGNEVRITQNELGKLNGAVNPTKLDDNDFTVLENIVKQRGNYGSLSKRFGIQRFNSNALSSSNLINLFEGKFNSGYKLLAKDTAGAGSSVMKYCASDYTGAWTSVSTSEYAGHYRFVQFKDKVYICNRIDGSYNLLDGKVWDGTANIYEHGASPYLTDTFTAASNATAGGLLTGKLYFYIVTNIYDGYQESSVLSYVSQETTGGQTAIKLSGLDFNTNNRVTGKNIYRSTGMTSSINSIPSEMYYLTTLTSQTPATYLDVIADSALGSSIPIETFFEQKRPYKSKYVTVSKDRLIQANLETATIKYSAISSGDIALTASAGVGALIPDKTYKYRYYKCFLTPSGGRYGFTVGEYTEKSITLGVADDAVTTAISNLSTSMDNWCNYILIQRTKAGGSEFYYLTHQTKSAMASYLDILSDSSLISQNTTLPFDVIYATGTGANNTKYPVINQSKYKSSISISEPGTADLIPAEYVKIIETKDNQGITGIHSEDNAVVIFSGSAIFRMNTSALNSEFWNITKVVEKIGALGQNTSPKTETSGHNGQLQLPNNSGYVFFNRAYSDSAQNQIKIYYWNGNDNAEPLIISDEINSYLNGFSSLCVYGMCYDHINNWIWISIKTSAQNILIYDLENKCWYVFVFGNSNILFYDIICTENGKIIIGADAGYLEYYAFDVAIASAFADKYYYSGSLQTVSFTTKMQTKTFDYFDADEVATRFGLTVNSLARTTTSGELYIVANGTSSNSTLTTDSETIHNIWKRFNIPASQIYFRYENSEQKGMTFQNMYMDIKQLHKATGGI